MMFQWWSAQPVAFARARRTVTATASAEKPNSTAPSGSAAVTASAMSAALVSTGSPVSARLISGSASSGSRKKSPLSETWASTPSTTSKSTTTSLPPGTLYSPW